MLILFATYHTENIEINNVTTCDTTCITCLMVNTQNYEINKKVKERNTKVFGKQISSTTTPS